jgi:hypothetical protein
MFRAQLYARATAIAVRVAGISAATVFAFGCSQSGTNWVKSATVTQSVQNSDKYVKLDAILSTGQTTFAAIGLPIMNSSGKIYGQVSVIPGTAGQAELIISADLKALGLDPTGAYVTVLPNGYPFPVIGATYSGYRLGTGGSEFYAQVAPDLKTASFGIALVIPGFMSTVPASAFVAYTASPNLSGMAGAFTAPVAAQSGFGLFANVNLGAIAGSTHNVQPRFIPTPMNSPDAMRIQEMLNRLNAEHAQLVIK